MINSLFVREKRKQGETGQPLVFVCILCGVDVPLILDG
jgi:hypothetical protein